jgi:hypothetical protein
VFTMSRKDRRDVTQNAKALDAAGLQGTPVTLGVVLICFGVLCTPIVTLFVLAESSKDRLVALEEHMKSVDEKVTEARSELKTLAEGVHVGGPLGSSRPGVTIPTVTATVMPNAPPSDASVGP